MDSLRKNSYAEPCRTLEPERDTAVNTPPAVRPYSAENGLVIRCTSSSASIPRSRPEADAGAPPATSERVTPSRRNEFCPGRDPLIENTVPKPADGDGSM